MRLIRAALALLLVAGSAAAYDEAGEACLDRGKTPYNRQVRCTAAAEKVLKDQPPGRTLLPAEIERLDKYLTVLKVLAVTEDAKLDATNNMAQRNYERLRLEREDHAPPGAREFPPMDTILANVSDGIGNTKDGAPLSDRPHILPYPYEPGSDTKPIKPPPGWRPNPSYPPEQESKDETEAAKEHLAVGHYRLAEQAAERAISLDPKSAAAWSALTLSRSALGDRPGAVDAAKQTLRLDPSDAPARGILGNAEDLARGAGKLGKAKLDFGEAPDAPALQGAIAPRAPGSGEGIVSSIKTVAFTPPPPLQGPAQAAFEAARGKLAMGDRTGALLAATRAVEAAPDSPLPLLMRAQISKALGNFKAVVADTTKALIIKDDDPRALRERAYALIELGRIQEALADLDRAIALEPGNGTAFLYRAMAYERLGKIEEALLDYARAAALDPSLEPLADEARARLKPGEKQAAPSAPIRGAPRALVRGGMIAGSLVLILAGLLGTARGRAALTTTAKTLFGRTAGAQLPPAADLPPGAVLGGNYTVARELGRGGMGVVYEAVDGALQRRVAIKRLRRDAGTTEEDFTRFLQEARTVAKLRHPRVAEIHNVLVDGDLYLVFEYVEGEPLDRVLTARGRLPLDQARRVLGDVASAIGAAHEQRIIHRDLKPSNIMLETSGSAKVMDFGIAHESRSAATALTRTSASGTPPYMAPEQAMGSVSKASDLYALAVMTYELIVGRRPFDGPDFLEQKLGKVYTAPSALGLPAKLDAFFARALAPDPTQRPSSAAAFLQELDAAR